MKAYGHSRRDKLTCKFGCCVGKSGKFRNCRDSVDRSNRKTSRQSFKKEIFESIFEVQHSGNATVSYAVNNGSIPFTSTTLVA